MDFQKWGFPRLTDRGGSGPKLKGGGAICRVGAKNIVKSKRAEGAQKFWVLIQEKLSSVLK